MASSVRSKVKVFEQEIPTHESPARPNALRAINPNRLQSGPVDAPLTCIGNHTRSREAQCKQVPKIALGFSMVNKPSMPAKRATRQDKLADGSQPPVSRSTVQEPTLASAVEGGATELEIDLSDWRLDRCGSGYLNVYEHKGKFKAQPSINGRREYLGSYDTPEDAATAVAKFMTSRGVPPPAKNTPTVAVVADADKQPERQPAEQSAAQAELEIDLSEWRLDRCGSGYLNVYEHKGKFKAQPSINGRREYLGSYDTPEDAATAVAKFMTSRGVLPPAKNKPTAASDADKQSAEQPAPCSPDSDVKLSELKNADPSTCIGNHTRSRRPDGCSIQLRLNHAVTASSPTGATSPIDATSPERQRIAAADVDTTPLVDCRPNKLRAEGSKRTERWLGLVSGSIDRQLVVGMLPAVCRCWREALDSIIWAASLASCIQGIPELHLRVRDQSIWDSWRDLKPLGEGGFKRVFQAFHLGRQQWEAVSAMEIRSCEAQIIETELRVSYMAHQVTLTFAPLPTCTCVCMSVCLRPCLRTCACVPGKSFSLLDVKI